MSERQFSIQNTFVSNSLVQIVGGAEWIPEITAVNGQGEIQFANIEVIRGWYTRIGKVINFELVFACDISAPAAETNGSFTLMAPETHIDLQAVNGMVIGALSLGVYGTVSHIDDDLTLNILNTSGGNISATDVVMNVSGSYLIN